MGSKIPAEREITKTQLWERTDAITDGIKLEIAGFQKRVEDIRSIVANDVLAILKEERKTIKSVCDKLCEELSLYKKQLEQTYNDRFSYLQQYIQAFEKTTQKQLADHRENVDMHVDKRLDAAVSIISERIDTLVNKIEDYQKTTDKTVKNYQVEMSKKHGEILKLFLEQKTKFKKLAEQLT